MEKIKKKDDNDVRYALGFVILVPVLVATTLALSLEAPDNILLLGFVFIALAVLGKRKLKAEQELH